MVLDFQKVKQKVIFRQERTQAQSLFGNDEEVGMIEKKVKIDEGKSIRKPVDVPQYLQMTEESLNFTS